MSGSDWSEPSGREAQLYINALGSNTVTVSIVTALSQGPAPDKRRGENANKIELSAFRSVRASEMV